MVRPICDLPPFRESLRDSESHLNAHSRGHAGPHGGCGYYIHVLFNKGIFRIDDDILENNEDYKFTTKMIGRSEPSFHYMA